MNESTLAHLRLTLITIVAFGCSVASFNGTLTAMGAAKAAPPTIGRLPL